MTTVGLEILTWNSITTLTSITSGTTILTAAPIDLALSSLLPIEVAVRIGTISYPNTSQVGSTPTLRFACYQKWRHATPTGAPTNAQLSVLPIFDARIGTPSTSTSGTYGPSNVYTIPTRARYLELRILKLDTSTFGYTLPLQWARIYGRNNA